MSSFFPCVLGGEVVSQVLSSFCLAGNSNIHFLPTGSNCHPVALIKRRLTGAEGYHGKDLPEVCKDGVRQKSFQVAGGGSLEISWLTSAEREEDARFLLKYECKF